jgi:hypothetical protein
MTNINLSHTPQNGVVVLPQLEVKMVTTKVH